MWIKKIRPYLYVFVLIVIILGLFEPLLGYFLLLVFAAVFAISPFRGRWFCGNLCPRGSFNDYLIHRISRHQRIPQFFSSLWLRIPVFVLLMGFTGWRLIQTQGVVNKIGLVFVTLCIVTTAIAIVLGVWISPRAWCTFCPMGTMQRYFGGKRYSLQVDLKKCTQCNICHLVCPMQLECNEIFHKPDCIKCGRCVERCPKGALYFE